MTTHPTREAFERYVIGAFDEIDQVGVEDHVMVCDDCARLLAREARLEIALFASAARAEFCPGCDRVCPGERCEHCGAAREAGGYRMRAVLAQSDHGRIYLAEAPTGERLAVKELVFTQVPEISVVEAFEREARLLRQLDHPSIPRYVDSFIEGEGVHMRFYLAQTYVEGVSLAHRLADHRFTEHEVRAIGRRVLRVLVYLQSLSPQVFHRDLKPSNILQRPDGSIALVDFGSARERGATLSGTFAGTFGYAPREQLVGMVDATSDLFGLGATLIHLLTRVSPWSALESGLELSKAHVSPALRRWLARMTAGRVAERFPSAEAALGALEALERPARRAVRVALGLGLAASVSSFAFSLYWHESGTTKPRMAPIVLPEVVTVRSRDRSLEPKAVVRPEPPRSALPPTSSAAAVRPERQKKSARPEPDPWKEWDGQPACQIDPKAPRGFVTINTVPPTLIYIQGKRIGRTPLARIELPSGCVEVEARSEDDQKRKTVRIKVEPRKNLRYWFTF